MTRLQDLDPAAHAFAQHNGISLAERPSGSWFSELFRKEMEVTSHDGGSASGKSYTTTFRSDMSEYERLTALQGEIHRSPAFQEFVELNGLQPTRQTTISAAPGSPERIANHHNETVAYMERAGATSQEIQSYRNAVWMNDQFGPGGTVETLLQFAAAKPGGYNSGGTRVMANQRNGSTSSPVFQNLGFNPPPGTRQIPKGMPDTWKIRPTQGEGGVWYYDPTNKGNAVRVMPGDPYSPFPNSQAPYVRWQRNGQPLTAR